MVATLARGGALPWVSEQCLARRSCSLPLRCVETGSARQCRAISRARGARCRNPAAYGMATCRYHGARRPETVRAGRDHPQWKHGQETLEAKAERSLRLAELRDLEGLMLALGELNGPRWRGRRPKRAL
jgi:hypothetical protein